MAQTCRYLGISRTASYRRNKRFDEVAEDGLADRPRTPHRSPRATAPAVVSKILYLRQNLTSEQIESLPICNAFTRQRSLARP
ncbi:MAG: hypothetical protein KJP16_07780 [Gammaproteobacteria bacterium]|nr:hypothetical protein [Gammaproteobacteria bacterium]NNL50703.1 hypothetical protein [Woeseiaceae bacterium]